MIFSSTSMFTSSMNLAASLTWLSRSVFGGLVHTSLAGTEKVSWHFPPSKWAPQTQVFGVSRGIFLTNFCNPFLRYYSFTGSRWKDSRPHTALALLHPPLPSTPERRRLNNCTSSPLKKAPFAQISLVCAFWHKTRSTRGHPVTKKSRTLTEIC